MRLVRYIFGLLLILLIVYSTGWYYIAGKIASEVNSKYAGQKIAVGPLVNDESYVVSFKTATSSGFPFGIAISLHGVQEETKEAVMSYENPINIGYSLLVQDAYVSYSGKIDAAFKPVQSNFGTELDINGYSIKASIPLSLSLITNLSNFSDPVEIINYIKGISIASKEVRIFDKQEGQLFYNKEYERLDISFIPAKHYHQMEELLGDIPKEYRVVYNVKSNAVKFASRRIPISLFYGFALLPANFNASAKAVIKTGAKTFKEFASDIDIKGEMAFTMPYLELNSLALDFKGNTEILKGQSSKLIVDGKIRIKEGFFQELFKQYNQVRPMVLTSPGGKAVDQEILYIIANKDAFRFKDLENSDYLMNIDMASSSNRSSSELKLNNFSIYSGDSGFKLTNESTMRHSITNRESWTTKGVLLLKNYLTIVDFTSAYVNRFGKFRFLNDDSRALYVDVNRTFLKTISDHPESGSNDLSIDYDINSDSLMSGKVGSTQIVRIPEIYGTILYQKLLGSVDPNGDVLKQIKRILPNVDENNPILQKLLPAFTGKGVKEVLPSEAQKIVPEKAKEVLKKVLPGKANKVGKDLLKKLGG